jgi:ureidoglycolate hydrolase
MSKKNVTNRRIILKPQEITAANFEDFGSLSPMTNLKEVGLGESMLLVFKGNVCARSLVLDFREMIISKMTRHKKCTECFYSTDSKSWYIAVIPADADSNIPDVSKLQFFFIPFHIAISLKLGTWHNDPFPSVLGSTSSYMLLQCLNTETIDRETVSFNEGLAVKLLPNL